MCASEEVDVVWGQYTWRFCNGWLPCFCLVRFSSRFLSTLFVNSAHLLFCLFGCGVLLGEENPVLIFKIYVYGLFICTVVGWI